ncbi:MAG: hypothetical protein ACR2FH_02510, partial [Caulobacteraceae bacterium]
MRGSLARWPMTYLATHGPRADPITALTWGLIALSLLVIAVIAVAVAAGVLIRRSRAPASGLSALPVSREGGGLTWSYVGLPLTVLALVGALIWPLQFLAAVER